LALREMQKFPVRRNRWRAARLSLVVTILAVTRTRCFLGAVRCGVLWKGIADPRVPGKACVDFRHNAVRVTAKPQWGFHPKNWDEREVPVPQKLIALLGKFKPKDAGPDDPVFPNLAGRPDGDTLDKLKRIAWRAKLNCGRCVTVQKLSDGSTRTNRCPAGPFCKRWFLHKFRHTYATRHLQDGIDIRTLQQWMGHHDASTMVYLKGVRNSDIQVRLNKGSLAAFA